MKCHLFLLLSSSTYFSTLQHNCYSTVGYICTTKVLSQVPNQYWIVQLGTNRMLSGDLRPSLRPHAELATDRLGLATHLSCHLVTRTKMILLIRTSTNRVRLVQHITTSSSNYY